MTLTVVEVIGRSKEGRTEPYICRCDDEQIYFVKGRSATRRGLINEWLCANLAKALELPIAPFAIATVPDELIVADLSGWLRDLGPGAVFASQRVVAQDLTASQVDAVPLAQRRDLLVFDWWVRNNDRTLTDRGGNVNLLWRPELGASEGEQSSSGLVVIDHNLAFDVAFSVADFCQSHVFAADLPETFSDWLLRAAYQDRLIQAMAVFQAQWDTVPTDWKYVDAEQTIPTDYPMDAVKTMLRYAQAPDFWDVKP